MNHIVLLITMLMSLTCCTQRMPSGPIRAYEYTHNNCTAFPVAHYQIVISASGTQTLIYSRNEAENHSVVLKEDALGKIDALVRKYKLYRLKRDYYPPFTVYDGWSWSLTVSYERDSFSSGGQNQRPPERLQAGIDAINGYVESLIPQDEENTQL